MLWKISLPTLAELKWSSVERGCAPVAQVLFVYAYYLAGMLYVLARPDADHFLDAALCRRLLPAFAALVAVAGGLLALGLWLRDRRPDSFLFQLAGSQFYCLSFLGLGFLVGPQSFAAGIVLMGAMLSGYVLLDRRVVLIGFAVSFPALLGLNVAAAYGLLPYAPLLRTPTDPAGVLFWTHASLFLAAPHLLVCTVATVVAIGEWRRREAIVVKIGLTDALTKAHNRRSILRLLEREVARARGDGPALALVLLDLDHFKRINDTWGHATGDRALRETVELLRRELRPGDCIGRFGGEEFLLLLPGISQAEAGRLVERCRAELAALEILADNDERVALSGSFGLACNEADPTLDAITLVRIADAALYRAKQGGRNRVELAALPPPGVAPFSTRPPLRADGEPVLRKGRRRWWSVLRHLVRGGRAWPPMARVILALALIAGMYLGFVAWAVYALVMGDRERQIDVGLMQEHLSLLLSAAGGIAVLLAAAVWLYRRRVESRVFQFVVMQYYALSLISMGYYIGMLSFPAGIMLAGSPLVGLIFFEIRIVLWSLGVGMLAFLGYTYATALGHIPYAPLIADSLSPYHPATPFWVFSYYNFVLPTMAVSIVLADQTLGRWRQRGEQVAELSRTDPLTGVHNRRSILRQLDRALDHSGPSAPLTVVMVDLDHFKRINDGWGHPAGDRVLREAARALEACLRQSDALGRYGGEEFLMVLPATTLEGGTILAERCRQRLAELVIFGEEGMRIPVTASFGLACSEEEAAGPPGSAEAASAAADAAAAALAVADPAAADRLIRRADAALYRAKASGRNRVETRAEGPAVSVAS
jgi:diguanylate cyclase (GGDEF)-like protein